MQVQQQPGQAADQGARPDQYGNHGGDPEPQALSHRTSMPRTIINVRRGRAQRATPSQAVSSRVPGAVIAIVGQRRADRLRHGPVTVSMWVPDGSGGGRSGGGG
ncbi:hypothetical protein KRMM14A1004_06010 [Krasilnikovia sp. MM14-A1004]